jgi:transposase InsO family protein
MNVTIQAGSHTVALPFIVMTELDERNYEYYDEPFPIKFSYMSRTGRRVTCLHTPDYFLISEDFVGWVECKAEEELARLREESPGRFVKEPSGWSCPPGQAYAEQYGLEYRLFSSAKIDWIFHTNINFLHAYMSAEHIPIDTQLAGTVIDIVRLTHGITLVELLEQAGAKVEHETFAQATTEESVTSTTATATAITVASAVTSPRPANRHVGQLADTIYTLIATRRIWVDLRAARLGEEPDRVLVFRDEQAAQTYTLRTSSAFADSALSRGTRSQSVNIALDAVLVWDEQRYTVLNLGPSKTTLLGENGRLVELTNVALAEMVRAKKIVGCASPWPEAEQARHQELQELRRRASPADEVEANRRFRVIAPRLYPVTAGDAAEAAEARDGASEVALGTSGTRHSAIHSVGAGDLVPERTQRRWRRKFRMAQARYGIGYDGLLPQNYRKGNYNPKLPQNTRTLLDRYIDEQYETIKQKSKRAVHSQYVLACERQGIMPASYKTFCKKVAGQDRYQQVMKRKGRRAAYSARPWFHALERTSPRHGDYPYNVVYIDHTQGDDELVCPETGKLLGRAWVSIAICGFTRRVPACFASFDAPSYRTNMMLVREIVRRTGYFPQIIVVDGGADFRSTYFDTLLARNNCMKKTRPAGEPRAGTVIERLFDTTNDQFFHNLMGNTQIMKEVRQVTKSVNPRGHAVWNLWALYASLCHFCYEVYDNMQHPTLGQSPREACLEGVAQRGAREHTLVAYDDDFIMQTLPSTMKGTAKVVEGGVKVNYVYYWCDLFRDAAIFGTQVPVKLDPWDAGHIFAFVLGQWVECFSEYHAVFAGRSEKEMHALTDALRNKYKQHNQAYHSINAHQLATFLESVEAQEALLAQQMRDRALQPILSALNSPLVNQSATLPMQSTVVLQSTVAQATGTTPHNTSLLPVPASADTVRTIGSTATSTSTSRPRLILPRPTQDQMSVYDEI